MILVSLERHVPRDHLVCYKHLESIGKKSFRRKALKMKLNWEHVLECVTNTSCPDLLEIHVSDSRSSKNRTHKTKTWLIDWEKWSIVWLFSPEWLDESSYPNVLTLSEEMEHLSIGWSCCERFSSRPRSGQMELRSDPQDACSWCYYGIITMLFCVSDDIQIRW